MAMDFPNLPTLDEEANGYRWDGEKWVFLGTITDTIGPIGLTLLMMGVRTDG